MAHTSLGPQEGLLKGMKTTKIEWTDRTWNPVTGCTKISAGCVHCYAEIMAHRLCAMGQEKYKNNFAVATHENTLNEPLLRRRPHTIFVYSMSDLFHEKVPFSFIDKVLNTINATPWHRYQLLTKRAGRMAAYFETRIVPDNVWLGAAEIGEQSAGACFVFPSEKINRIRRERKWKSGRSTQRGNWPCNSGAAYRRYTSTPTSCPAKRAEAPHAILTRIRPMYYRA
jgi:hypothetical protein